ncbi:MAG: nitroreductase family protein [Nanoarchaeota archaeon]|nr:nitroreductase family protein [Nanoarchaeota archaeon]
MHFETLTKKRASIKRFSSKKPDIDDIIKIIEIGNLSPSPGNLPILRYLIIEDKEKINKIADACMQEFIKQASVLIIVCSEPKDCVIAYEARGKKYIKQHAGAAIQNMLLAAVDLGLASCWVGAYSDITIKTLLGISDNADIEAILPIGYKLITDRTVQRKKQILEGRIFFEKYKNKYRKPLPRATV